MKILASGSEEAKEDFINFLEKYALYICLGVVLIIIVTIVVIYVIKNNKKKVIKDDNFTPDKDNNLLGEKDNIISIECTGSRINIVLKDYSKVDKEGLKLLGVNNFIQMNDKLILISDNPDKILAKIR